jgi:hypothetical protein
MPPVNPSLGCRHWCLGLYRQDSVSKKRITYGLVALSMHARLVLRRRVKLCGLA